MKRCIAALAAVLLSGCATPVTEGPEVSIDARNEETRRQQEYVLAVRSEETARLLRIAEHVKAANVELCHRRALSIGAHFESIYDYAGQMRAAAKAVHGVSGKPQVTWLDERGPAAKAGLRMGDQLLAVNGSRVASGPKAGKSARGLLAAALHGSQNLQIQRGDQVFTFDIVGRQVCGYPFFIADSDDVNAFADGDRVVFMRGMMRFVKNDDELALIVGHELAHNVMGHIDKSKQNALWGALGGALIDIALAAGGINTGGDIAEAGAQAGALAHSPEFESEADYVGLYFAARAGYDVERSEEFWRRRAVDNPSSIRKTTTHPTSVKRFLTLAATRREIAERKEAGQPLLPRLKKDSPL
ncbi:M48 family metallopeptidase [Caulobacter sp. NIBR2454]|uniref:M48 family metallopeptidase n=1 Tax=Caulobacter sp. NIBR2454 TaxID=3015996 RepID=UPI0022B6A514|nr:M48 family metallopeptidase [Caulobacter sp. NIBR2454]